MYVEKNKYKGEPTVYSWLTRKDHPQYDPFEIARDYVDHHAKPCPLCGNKVKLVTEDHCGGHGEYYNIWYIKCDSCRLSKMLYTPLGEKTDIKEHVRLWNVRFDG